MQLASSMLDIAPMQVNGLLPPSRMFAIADRHLSTAAAVLDRGEVLLPSVVDASLAMEHTATGMRMLRSALVPSTPFRQRQAAAAGIEQAQLAVAGLQSYVDVVDDLGAAPLPRGAVDASTRALLEQVRAQLTVASAVIR